MSRPRSAQRQQLTAFVSNGGEFTMGALARRFGWPLERANDAIKRAKASGEIACVRTERVTGVKRPVAVYAQPTQAERAPGADPLHAAMRGWSR